MRPAVKAFRHQSMWQAYENACVKVAKRDGNRWDRPLVLPPSPLPLVLGLMRRGIWVAVRPDAKKIEVG